MKSMIIFSSLLFLLFSCKTNNTETPKTDLKTEIITSSYSLKEIDGKMVKDTVNMIQSMIVDHTGKELSNLYYNLDGTVAWRDDYIYNEDGFKIGSKYFENNVQTAYYEYQIDKEGRRLSYEAKNLETDTLLYDGASRYENNGQLRKDGYINKAGDFIWNYEYHFDENENLIKRVYVSNKSGKSFPSTFNTISQNSDGEWTERETINQDGEITAIEVRTFSSLPE